MTRSAIEIVKCYVGTRYVKYQSLKSISRLVFKIVTSYICFRYEILQLKFKQQNYFYVAGCVTLISMQE
jgi:hypothetical protein